jgi:hypothetical protein
MNIRVSRALLALAFLGSLAAAGAAPPKPTIAVMPTQYVAADAVSGANVAVALVTQLQASGYTVVSLEDSRKVFRSMRLSWSRPHAPRAPIQFGRQVDAQLVVYPRLLSLGTPRAQRTARAGAPSVATLHLQVYNVRTGKRIYAHQVRTEFEWARLENGAFVLSPGAASNTVAGVLRPYLERVAGSKEELSAGR